MSVLDTAKARFSVRAYTEQAVEEEKLQKILEIAKYTCIGVFGGTGGGQKQAQPDKNTDE